MNLLQNMKFVFGSNEGGRHGKGAAQFAAKYYGAKYGQGNGIMGDSYGIPTKSASLGVLDKIRVKRYVDEFLYYARSNRDTMFQMTRIGCGLAGYKDEDIYPMFERSPDNVYLPGSWMKHLRTLDRARLIVYGSDRIDAELIEKSLTDKTVSWNGRFEVVTTAGGQVSDVAQAWARRNNLPWTPFPPDSDRFGDKARIILPTQLSWYSTHAMIFDDPTCIFTKQLRTVSSEYNIRSVIIPFASSASDELRREV